MMEDRHRGYSNAIMNTKEFANQITINLFKKRSNSKFFGQNTGIKSSSRKPGSLATRNVRVMPRKPNRNQVITGMSAPLPEQSIISITNSSAFSSSLQDQANLVTNVSADQITDQVNTPFSSSVINSIISPSEKANECQSIPVTTISNHTSQGTYSTNMHAYQTSQASIITTSMPVSSSQNNQIFLSNLQPPDICTSEPTTAVTQNQTTADCYPGHQLTNYVQSKKPNKTPQTSHNDDLTSLSWLQSLDMGGVVPHLATPPTPPASPPLGSNLVPEKTNKEETTPEKIDYSLDGSVKPPYSYAALIGMAMKENENKMTLSAIYKWIKEHYVYYKTADQSWQNSIRHNLSLNKCFLKVARSKDEPGKGGFWKLDPEYADSLVDGVFKKRRPSRGTAPPATKSKRSKRPFTLTQQQQIQQQVQKQRLIEQEEHLRQKEQEEAVRSLLQPVQEAYMPPPTDRPPSICTMYMDQHEPLERTLLVEDNGNQLKDDFVWSSFLGDESAQDDTWQLGAQEVVTDITQSGDPSTYQVTASPTPSTTSLSSSSSMMSGYSQQLTPALPLQTSTASHHQIPTLPSYELSPESLGVEEDLFGTPEYSEASTDEGDSLISSFDLGVGLDLAVSTTPWENKSTCEGAYNIINNLKDAENVQPMNQIDQGMLINAEGSQDLVEFHDFEGNLTQLTTLEPAAPVVVQQIPQPGWNQEQQSWEDAKTISFLEANLDFDKLIDLDVLY